MPKINETLFNRVMNLSRKWAADAIRDVRIQVCRMPAPADRLYLTQQANAYLNVGSDLMGDLLLLAHGPDKAGAKAMLRSALRGIERKVMLEYEGHVRKAEELRDKLGLGSCKCDDDEEEYNEESDNATDLESMEAKGNA